MKHAALALLLLFTATPVHVEMAVADCMALAETISPLLQQTSDLLHAMRDADRLTETVRLRTPEGEERVALEQAGADATYQGCADSVDHRLRRGLAFTRETRAGEQQ